MRQLPIDLPTDASYREEDFLVSNCNSEAWARITRWPQWDTRILLLQGEPQSGKTHLAHIWAARSTAPFLPARQLTDAQNPDALFDNNQALVIEDIEQLVSEIALFHLLNAVKASQQYWLLLTRNNRHNWEDVKLPDLRSRLQALPQAEIKTPDDHLLGALLLKHFHDRQVTVGEGVIHYLLPRMERSYAAVLKVAEALDKEAIACKTPITLAMARQLLTEN
jgi:chromosomal replication initiation ATPase DnaA